MNKTAVALAFIGGFYVACLLTTLFMLVHFVNPIKRDAIKLGYAEMKLQTPYDTKSVFTWKEGAK